MESVSKRGTVDISRNYLNPFHVSFHATDVKFHVSFPRSTQISGYFLAKLTQNPRKIHGKKSRDMRDSTFVSVRDINITLTVLYQWLPCLALSIIRQALASLLPKQNIASLTSHVLYEKVRIITKKVRK